MTDIPSELMMILNAAAELLKDEQNGQKRGLLFEITSAVDRIRIATRPQPVVQRYEGAGKQTADKEREITK